MCYLTHFTSNVLPVCRLNVSNFLFASFANAKQKGAKPVIIWLSLLFQCLPGFLWWNYVSNITLTQRVLGKLCTIWVCLFA